MREPGKADAEGESPPPDPVRSGLHAVRAASPPAKPAPREFLNGDLVEPGRDKSTPGYEFRRELRRRAHEDELVEAVLAKMPPEAEADAVGRGWVWLIVIVLVLATGFLGSRLWHHGREAGNARQGIQDPNEVPLTAVAQPAPEPVPADVEAAPATTPVAPVAAGEVPAAANPDGASVAALLATAREFAARNDWTTPAGRCALDAYREVLRREPGQADAVAGIASVVDFFVRRGGELSAGGDRAGALVRYEKARWVLETAGVAAGLADVDRRRLQIDAAVAAITGAPVP